MSLNLTLPKKRFRGRGGAVAVARLRDGRGPWWSRNRHRLRALTKREGDLSTSSGKQNPSAPPPAPTEPPKKPIPHFWDRWRRTGQHYREASWASVYQDLVRWFLLALPIGVVAGLGAALFYYLVTETSQFFLTQISGVILPTEGTSTLSNLVWSSEFPRVLLVPVVMVFGALVVGAVTWAFAPEIAGHGTDAAIRAFHRRAGRIRARVPILKTLVSSLTLGTGGTGGREGPVAQIGGGFGSIWADLVRLGDRDRRVALATGMGAGIGAIFRAPLGGAVYAAEILYTADFEPDVFVPAIIASVVSYSVYSSIWGFHSLFATPASLATYSFDPVRLPFYAVLGVVCGGAGLLFTWMYLSSERWFASMHAHPILRPAIGAALASVVFVAIYLALPQQAHFAALSSLSLGYGFVQATLLSTNYSLMLFGILAVAVLARMVMTSWVVGGGGAAGLFGTSVVVGAFIGTVVGGVFHDALPSLVPIAVVPVFSIIGMMTFFGGISKAPLAVLIMVTEMAGSYTVLPAAMLSIFVAYVITGRTHIYTEQLPSRIQSPAHLQEYRGYFLTTTPVGDIATQQSEPVTPSTTVQDAIDVAVTHGRSTLSVEVENVWWGSVRLSDLLDVPVEKRHEMQVVDLVKPVELLLASDLSAEEALRRMDETGSNVAAVVSVDPPIRVVGVVTRRGIQDRDLSAAGLKPLP